MSQHSPTAKPARFAILAVTAIGLVASVLLTVAAGGCKLPPREELGSVPPASRGLESLKSEPAWPAGRVDEFVYDVTRQREGKAQKSVARASLRVAWADPVTKTLAASPDPQKHREVFVWRVTEEPADAASGTKVDTTVYVGRSDLKSLKLEINTVEAEGGTYKQYVNHKGTLEWHQFSHRAGEGHKSGTYNPPANFVYADALPVVLRGVESPIDVMRLSVALLPEQGASTLTPSDPLSSRGSYEATVEVDTPMGKVPALKLRIETGQQLGSYWLASDAGSPVFRAMIRSESPDGTTWLLRSWRSNIVAVK